MSDKEHFLTMNRCRQTRRVEYQRITVITELVPSHLDLLTGTNYSPRDVEHILYTLCRDSPYAELCICLWEIDHVSGSRWIRHHLSLIIFIFSYFLHVFLRPIYVYNYLCNKFRHKYIYFFISNILYIKKKYFFS